MAGGRSSRGPTWWIVLFHMNQIDWRYFLIFILHIETKIKRGWVRTHLGRCTPTPRNYKYIRKNTENFPVSALVIFFNITRSLWVIEIYLLVQPSTTDTKRWLFIKLKEIIWPWLLWKGWKLRVVLSIKEGRKFYMIN